MACSTHVKRTFADIATAIAQQSGRPITFLLAALIIIVWAVSGPIFHYSDTWQLIINTGTQAGNGAQKNANKKARAAINKTV